ncbi:hypothetical protein IW262DRAFT_1468761 [Armillaria fumosa]|nr:hypothetical protein IW262DRAFT_1468761 [Armillaria fumosa]
MACCACSNCLYYLGNSSTVHAASRGIVAYYDAFGPLTSPRAIYLEKAVNWALLYASLIMATLLWCTILIIYCILRVGGAAGRIHVYQRVIEMLVESAALYSTMIVVVLVFEAHNEVASRYIESLASAMRGMIPTMLVGRVAAGHARPDDSWSESTPRSSIRFGNHSASQNDTQMSVGSGWDTSLTAERPDLGEGMEDSTEFWRPPAFGIWAGLGPWDIFVNDFLYNAVKSPSVLYICSLSSISDGGKSALPVFP